MNSNIDKISFVSLHKTVGINSLFDINPHKQIMVHKEPCTGRERVQRFIGKNSEDYCGRSFHDVYITASALADVLGCSNQTARRRLDYFEEQGVIERIHSARVKNYMLTKELTGADEDLLRSRPEIIHNARKIIYAAIEVNHER